MKKYNMGFLIITIILVLLAVGVAFKCTGSKRVLFMSAYEEDNKKFSGAFTLQTEEDIKNLTETPIEDDGVNSEFYVNVKNVSVSSLLKLICKLKGYIINYDDSEISGVKITLYSENPMHIDVIYEAIIQALSKHGLRISNSDSGMLTIRPKDDLNGLLNLENNHNIMTRIIKFTVPLDQIKQVLIPPLVSTFCDIKYVSKTKPAQSKSQVSSKDNVQFEEPEEGKNVDYNIAIVTDYKDNVEKIYSLVKAIEYGGSEFIILKYEPTHVSSEDLYALVSRNANDYFSGRKFTIIDKKSSNFLLLMGRGFDVDFVWDALHRLDTENAQEFCQEMKVILMSRKLINSNPEDVLKALHSRGKDLNSLNSKLATLMKSAYIIPNSKTILFHASSDEDAAYINSMIDTLENKAQVYIDMLIVSLDASKMSSLGIDWSAKNPSSQQPGTTPSYFSQLISSVDNGTVVDAASLASGFGVGMIGRLLSVKGSPLAIISAIANVLSKDSSSRILSQPYLGGVEGEKAEIFIGQTVPVTTGTQTMHSTQGGSIPPVSTAEQIATIDIGTRISFVANIDNDDIIRINLLQEITNVPSSGTDTSTAGPVSYRYPMVTKMQYQSTILVPNEAIMVIGGLTMEGTATETEGIPCSSSLCGVLRSIIRMTAGKSIERSYNQNMLIFLKPTIVRTESDIYAANKDKYKRIYSRMHKKDSGKMDDSLFWDYVNDLKHDDA